MKISKLNIIKSICTLLIVSQISCRPEEVINNTSDRLFAPAMLSGLVIENTINLSWVPIANASYSLELSKDSLLFSNELMVVPLDGKTYYSFSDLWSNTRYSARIKAISKDSTIKNSIYNEITFKTKTENIFYQIADADITTSSVLLKWVKGKTVDKILVYPDGDTIKTTITLTSDDIASGTKLITGLVSGKTFNFEIYWGKMQRGVTWADIP